jgi:exopolysaccharide biosynthesis polyprenyl glycosylphosphotransferase
MRCIAVTMLSDKERDEVQTAPPLGPETVVLSPAWGGWQRVAKRVLDFSAALVLLILLAPVMALIAIVVRLDSHGSALFRQTRCGKNGRPFTFLKFRGMVADAEERLAEIEHLNEAQGPIFKIREDPRVTRVGRFIRRTSLDELPQLWNVLRGEMSLVGPRPPIPSEVVRYEPWQRNRLGSTPGITGLWQVSGRSELSFDDMVRLDVEYIERWTFWLDLQILFRTVATVISARGAY